MMAPAGRRGRAGQRAARAATIAAVVAVVALLIGGLGPAAAQPGPGYGDDDVDAGVADGGLLSDGGAGLGPDASTRVLIDGPTMLGIGRPQVSAAAAPSEVRLADKLTLYIEVTYDERVTVALSAGLELSPVFDELKRSSVDERRTDGTRKRTYQIQLQVWEVGDLRIPPIQVSYSVGGESSWVVTNEVPIRVVETLASIDDPNAFLGAAAPVELRRRDWRWIAAGIVLGGIAVIGLITWLVSRRRKHAARPALAQGEGDQLDHPDVAARVAAAAIAGPGAPPVVAAPVAPRPFILTLVQRRQLSDAARRALDALDALDRAGTLRTDQPEGYRQMVAIVRAFAEEQFVLPPRHRTSGELLRALTRTRIRPPALASAARWFAQSDLIKFANEHVPDAAAAAALDAARSLVVEAAHPDDVPLSTPPEAARG